MSYHFQAKARRPKGEVAVLNKGFWRVRGLAIRGNSLCLCSESNREGRANAGQLVRIDTTTGDEGSLLNTLDYPQLPAVSPTQAGPVRISAAHYA